MKKYFIKRQVIEQCERMIEKYLFLADNLEWDTRENNLNMEDSKRNYCKADELRELSDKLQNTIYRCCIGNTYQGVWDDVKFLKEQAEIRNNLDYTIECSR